MDKAGYNVIHRMPEEAEIVRGQFNHRYSYEEGEWCIMDPIIIDLPVETRKRLDDWARKVGKPPEIVMREIVETALQLQEQEQPKTAREVLIAMGRVVPLSETLRRKIIPGVTLDEVRTTLTRAGKPSLSEIILEQRGPKV